MVTKRSQSSQRMVSSTGAVAGWRLFRKENLLNMPPAFLQRCVIHRCCMAGISPPWSSYPNAPWPSMRMLPRPGLPTALPPVLAAMAAMAAMVTSATPPRTISLGLRDGRSNKLPKWRKE